MMGKSLRIASLLVLGLISACSTATDFAAAVIVVNDRAGIAGCAPLGQIQTQSFWGGFAATGIGYNDALAQLKNETARRGGTHVLLVNASNTMGGSNFLGDAYRCS